MKKNKILKHFISILLIVYNIITFKICYEAYKYMSGIAISRSFYFHDPYPIRSKSRSDWIGQPSLERTNSVEFDSVRFDSVRYSRKVLEFHCTNGNIYGKRIRLSFSRHNDYKILFQISME
jgi:hypothetical protein